MGDNHECFLERLSAQERERLDRWISDADFPSAHAALGRLEALSLLSRDWHQLLATLHDPRLEPLREAIVAGIAGHWNPTPPEPAAAAPAEVAPDPEPILLVEASTPATPNGTPQPQPTLAVVETPPPANGVVQLPIGRIKSGPKPKPGKEIGAARDTFFAAVQPFDYGTAPSHAESCCARAAVCLGRYAQRICGEECDIEVIQDEIERLGQWLRIGEHGDFFGFGHHHLNAGHWDELAEAYRCLAAAWEATEFREEGRPSEKLLRLATSAEMWLELVVTRLVGVHDSPQTQLRNRLQALADQHHIQIERNPGRGEADLRKDAKLIEGETKSARTAAEKRANVGEAWARLHQVLARTEADDFEEALQAAVVGLLAAGCPPSDRDLRDACMPYFSLLNYLVNKSMGKLKEYLLSDSEVAHAQIEEDLAEDEVDPDPDHLRRVEDLRHLLQGKVMLVCSGLKGQNHRPEEIREALGLAEVIWPDAEEHSGIGIFDAPRQRADIVVQSKRFCRHSYQSVLNKAKSEGKLTAVLKAGLSVRRITHDLHEQLVANCSLAV